MMSSTPRTIRRGARLVAVLATASLGSSAARAGQANLHWVDARAGEVPAGAIVGGWEPGRTLYVCRAWYRDGWHPGKIVGETCNIGWGGNEVTIETYQVLVGDGLEVSWVRASDGGVPAGAFSGGSEPGRPNLYVCRGYYRGYQPGKIVGSSCNVGYGGKEILLNPYEVLVPER